ncbi:MAG: hypothetical protein ACPG1Z_07980, partial [Planctomycetota bacterium]
MPGPLLRPILLLITTLLILLASFPIQAQHSNSAPRPDLTAGGSVPEGWTHDWNLGPTGARGWIYCDKH